VVLCRHVLVFPVASFFLLLRRVPRLEHQSKAFATTWRNYIAADFHPRFFWMYHVNTGLLLVLAVVLAFMSDPTPVVQVSGWVGGSRAWAQLSLGVCRGGGLVCVWWWACLCVVDRAG
jgi:hypothetical protein